MSFAGDIGRMVARGPQRELTQQETMVLLNCMMMCEEETAKQIELYEQIMSSGMSGKILDQRFRYHFGEKQTMSPPLLIWFSTLADRPGTIILLLAVLAHAKEQGHELSLNNIVNNYFAEGIPSEVNYNLAWDAQKVTEERAKTVGIDKPGSDNMLDHQQSWT